MLDAVVVDPSIGKELRDELVGHRGVRIGRLRVVYRDVGDEVIVVGIGPRATIYEEVARRLIQ